MFRKSLILLDDGQVASLTWFPLKYAALNDCQIRISSGGETKKIKVLGSEPNQSLAKSPNAQQTAIYTILELFFQLPVRGKRREFVGMAHMAIADCEIRE
jgi:hypothetical protein